MAIDSAVLELRLVGNISGSFCVKRYQRGYRWGEIEVNQLLNDIWESKGKPYSLQPIVVKRDEADDTKWELIDGQQRLTTLFLVFAFMQRDRLQNADAPYSITYETRQDSNAYLQSFDANLADGHIDSFHLNGAYECIRAWFKKYGARSQYVANAFYGCLFESVHVIWYEAPKELLSTALFTRLNIGRIPLTDAELVKALLLTRSHTEPGTTDRVNEIAAQWDIIERDLQHPDIWAFVANDAAVESPTRISLLLDTLAGAPVGRERQRFHTFDALRENVEKQGDEKAGSRAEELWNNIVALHALVLGWYENRNHYHKIGFLVAAGKSFSSLVALASDKLKSKFEIELDSLIRDTLDLSPSDIPKLKYDNDYEKCRLLLILMNVEMVRRVKNSTERYPFKLHHGTTWSLEHIHAQQQEELAKKEQWTTWIDLHRKALADLQIDHELRSDLLRRMDDAKVQLDRPIFRALARDVTAAFSCDDGATGQSVHSVSNLALLERGHNSALRNAVFEVKRLRILELDQNGEYIPIATRQVFLKYFTNADAHQIHFWSPHDRNAYLEVILSPDRGVGAYLKAENPMP